jgi:hypothetical protein
MDLMRKLKLLLLNRSKEILIKSWTKLHSLLRKTVTARTLREIIFRIKSLIKIDTMMMLLKRISIRAVRTTDLLEAGMIPSLLDELQAEKPAHSNRDKALTILELVSDAKAVKLLRI